ncbi:peptidase S58 family protein, partial [bacterium]
MPTPAPPPFPEATRDLSIPGFLLGHGADRTGLTGVTVILCPAGVTAAAEVRGSATGTRQFDSLVSGHHVASKAHAVVLAGGSGYGLSAADPVVAWLAGRGYGFQTGIAPVPIVPTAILFDLALGAPVAPGPELVEAALESAVPGPVAVGSVGAGVGATVGKALGPLCGMKGGFGFASFTVSQEGGDGPTVAAAVAINAFGDVR